MDLFKTQQAPQTGLFPAPAPASALNTAKSVGSSVLRIVMMVVGGVLLVVVLYYIYSYFTSGGSGSKSAGSVDTEDLVPSAADGQKTMTLPETSFPAGEGSDYGLQFWLYIKDWDFNFGKEKTILSRKAGVRVTLHPTDNSLNVTVPIYPSGSSASSTSPTGDIYTCTVENVPLQAWFAVSATVFQRNLDVYINGQLVKSCVLPGIPKLSSGDMTIGDPKTGFSGAVCNLKHTPRALLPADATAFYGAGSSCGKPAAAGAQPEGKGFTLFGYTFSFSVFKKGESKALQTYSLG